VIDLGIGAPLWPLAVVAVVGCLLAVGVIVWLTVRSRRH
jgi:nitrate reductase NapE component